MGRAGQGRRGGRVGAGAVLAELGHCLIACLGAGIAASAVLGLAVLLLAAAP